LNLDSQCSQGKHWQSPISDAVESPTLCRLCECRAFTFDGQRSTATLTLIYYPSAAMMQQLLCVLSYLLAATAFVLPSVPSRSSNGSLQDTFQVQSRIPADVSDRARGWDWPPNPNSTHHLIFNSVSGLLRRWPNTLRRNGALDFHQSHGKVTSHSLPCTRSQSCTRDNPQRDNFIPRAYRRPNPK